MTANFSKVKNSVYELPKEGAMRVPVRLYATEQMLPQLQRDRSLSQASNVAQLPGIQKYSFVMPDGHEGYGFPIGGVAAFDANEGGVISPGGVGYDINCLCKGARILSSHGWHKPIEEFESEFGNFDKSGNYLVSLQAAATAVSTLDCSEKTFSNAKLLAFLKKKADGRILKIKTRLGLEILCSEDHPLLLSGGAMMAAGKTSAGLSLATSFFEGVPYEKIPASRLPQGVPSENALGTIAKILGYLFGDGSLSKSGKKLRACAFGRKTDLEKMSQDLQSIGVKATVFERTRRHCIKTQYGTKEFQSTCSELAIYSQDFCKLLQSLGLPLGKKASQVFSAPEWLFQSPLWVKRLFLAGFFGAELSSPSTITKTGFAMPVVSQNKNVQFAESGRMFLIQLMQLLEEFGVKTSKISQRDEYENKQGKTIRLRLVLAGDEDNLLLLYRKIGLEYSREKSALSQIACKYILLKKQLTKKREEIAKKTRELKSKGLTLSETQKLLSSPLANGRFIERHYYEQKAGQRITLGFESFKKFAEKERQAIATLGTLCDEISSVEEIAYEGEVYDFTVEKTHNFIANGIIVSNCGVRLLRTNLHEKDVRPKLKEIISKMYENIPSGVGSKSRIRLNPNELEEAVTLGSKWAVEHEMGVQNDLEHCEENGAMKGVNYSAVSDMAKKRGGPQFGTLGAGNHFLEIQKVEKILEPETAKAFGIDEGQITVMIHCGSRGYGHQVCDDYLRTMIHAAEKYKIPLPDRELCCAPIDSPEAQNYLGAMRTAVNFAFCNRQVISHWVRETFRQAFQKDWETLGMSLVYDVAHNIAKMEQHEVDGKSKTLCVHRKGATRAFWKNHPEIPSAYRTHGQPVIIPGSMNTASYLLCGLEGAKETWGSTCHGAGRTMSRHEALRQFKGSEIQKQMEAQGMAVRAGGPESLAEEAGGAYKDVSQVVQAVENAGLCKIVAKMVPLGVIKG